MNRYIKKIAGGFVLASILGLSACSGGSKGDAGAQSGSQQPQAQKQETKKTIKFGTTAGDFGDMVKEKIKGILEKEGYKVELTEFSDYVRPNLALAEGAIDVNVFQHKPYLDDFAKTHNLDLTPVFMVPTAPLGIYPGKLKKLDEVKDGSTVSLANDPSNLARALVMLDTFGWIKINPQIDPLTVSVKDIIENKHNIKLVELEAAQIPRSRSDVDFAVVNGNYAVSSGIPLTEALYQEPSYAYVNVGVIRTSDKDAPWVQDVIKAYKSQEFKDYCYTRFPGYKYPLEWGEEGKKAEGGAEAAPAEAKPEENKEAAPAEAKPEENKEPAPAQ